MSVTTRQLMRDGRRLALTALAVLTMTSATPAQQRANAEQDVREGVRQLFAA
jgi:hypothetical protein